MHEYAMASELASRVLDEAERRQAIRVMRVLIRIGELTMLESEQLRFNYDLVTEGNEIMEGSQLDIEKIPAKVQCEQCGYLGPIQKLEDKLYHTLLPTLTCPTCGNRVSILEGRDFIIQAIDMEVP